MTAAERPEVEAEDMGSRDYMDAEEKGGILANIETDGGLKNVDALPNRNVVENTKKRMTAADRI